MHFSQILNEIFCLLSFATILLRFETLLFLEMLRIDK